MNDTYTTQTNKNNPTSRTTLDMSGFQGGGEFQDLSKVDMSLLSMLPEDIRKEIEEARKHHSNHHQNHADNNSLNVCCNSSSADPIYIDNSPLQIGDRIQVLWYIGNKQQQHKPHWWEAIILPWDGRKSDDNNNNIYKLQYDALPHLGFPYQSIEETLFLNNKYVFVCWQNEKLPYRRAGTNAVVGTDDERWWQLEDTDNITPIVEINYKDIKFSKKQRQQSAWRYVDLKTLQEECLNSKRKETKSNGDQDEATANSILLSSEDYITNVFAPFQERIMRGGKGKPTEGITVLEIFGGVGSGTLVLKKLGIDITKIIFVEPDRVSSFVYRRNHVGVGADDNIDYVFEHKTFESLALNHNGLVCHNKITALLEQQGPIDIIIGGPPCQDFSEVNAHREGVDGKNGCYIVKFARFIRGLEQLQLEKYGHPVYFLVENVILKGEDLKTVNDAFQFTFNPIALNAKYFSASERNRHYWSNVPIKNIDYMNLTKVRPESCLESGFFPPGMFVQSQNISKVNCLMAAKGRLDNTSSLGMYVFQNQDNDGKYWGRPLEVQEREKLMGFPPGYVGKAIEELFGTLSNRHDELKIAPLTVDGKVEFLNAEEYGKRIIGLAFSVPVVEFLLQRLQSIFRHRTYSGYNYGYAWEEENCVRLPQNLASNSQELTDYDQGEWVWKCYLRPAGWKYKAPYGLSSERRFHTTSDEMAVRDRKEFFGYEDIGKEFKKSSQEFVDMEKRARINIRAFKMQQKRQYESSQLAEPPSSTRGCAAALPSPVVAAAAAKKATPSSSPSSLKCSHMTSNSSDSKIPAAMVHQQTVHQQTYASVPSSADLRKKRMRIMDTIRGRL